MLSFLKMVGLRCKATINNCLKQIRIIRHYIKWTADYKTTHAMITSRSRRALFLCVMGLVDDFCKKCIYSIDILCFILFVGLNLSISICNHYINNIWMFIYLTFFFFIKI